MAKTTVTKETMVKNLVELEDKLMDFIPEGEENTERTKVLDELSTFNAELVKTATDEEIKTMLDKAKAVLNVENEKKKAKKKAEKARVENEVKKSAPKKSAKSKEEKADESAEEPKQETPKKKMKKAEKKEESVAEFKFPKEVTLDLEDDEKGVFVQKKIKDLADLDLEADIVLTQWTEDDLKTYTYSEIDAVRKVAKFDGSVGGAEDVDILNIIFNEGGLMYAQSVITNVIFSFTNTGVNKEMVHLGLPWQVYTLKK